MLSDKAMLIIGGIIFAAMFAGGTYRIIKQNRSSTTTVPAKPEIPTGIVAQRLRDTFEQFELKFLLDLAYIASGLGAGSNAGLREQIQTRLFDADGWQIFANHFNRLVQIPGSHMYSPQPIEEVCPFNPAYLFRNDELLTFLAKHALTLRRLHFDILWMRDDCIARVAWTEAESILNRLESIYGEYDIAPEHA